MTIVASCGIVLGSGLLGLIFYSMVSDKGVMALVSAYVATNLELSLALYKGIGIPQETIDTISNSLDQIHYVLVRLLPSLAAVSTLFVAWTNLIAARPLLARRGLYVPDYGRSAHEKRIYEKPAKGCACIAFPACNVILNSQGSWYKSRVTEDHIVGLKRTDDHPENGIDH